MGSSPITQLTQPWPPTLEAYYRASIGKARDDLVTPALILDADVARKNIHTLAERVKGLARPRPHAKSSKCAQIAMWQMEAGAIGITVATVGEATALARSGIKDILIANEVAGAEKLRQLAELAGEVSIMVLVDDCWWPGLGELGDW